MTEMQSAIGLSGAGANGRWNMPTRSPQRHIVMDALYEITADQVHADRHTRAARRWFTMAFSLDIENMKCDIMQFVKAAARGRSMLESLLAAVPH